MKINFTNETDYDVLGYIDLIKKVFKPEKNKKYFNLIFVDKATIQEINKTYRNIDRVTDVITFALTENTVENIYGDQNELGDVFICVDRAIEQAAEYGHSIEREMGFLAVHGYLHLMGYDHMTPEDEKIMFKKQDEILAKANLERGNK